MSHLVARPPQSRLWHHGPAVLAAAAVTVLLLSAPEAGSTTGAVLAVGALQLVLVLSWPIALVFRGYVGAALIGAGAAAAADVVIVRGTDDRASGTVDSGLFGSDDGLGPLAAVLALALVLAFVHQLTRRPPRRDVTDSLAGDVLLALAVVAASTYLVLFRLTDGPVLLETCVAAIGAAVVTGHLVDLVLPYPRIVDGVPRGLLGFVLGTAAAMLAAMYRGETDRLVEQLGAVILGGVLGGLACLIAIGASYAATERRGVVVAQSAVQAVLPFALAAPVAYLMSILVGG
ncbi:MAG: hypothetical protein H0V10_04030 [Geodermatophilaceae bacterium]|nr:hypothetical protein [Geodermatophilaceae bacterium]